MEAVKISDTFGVMLTGAFIAMSIYGITTLQTYFYYTYYPKDGLWTKLMVGVIWILDTVHIILMCHGAHHYLIEGFGNVALLSDGTWSLYASIALNVLIAFVVQCYFTRKIHLLTPGGYKWWVTGIIGLTVFAHFCFGMETVVFLLIKKKFARLKEISLNSALPFGVTAVLSDIAIAVALCFLLHRNRSEFEDTNRIINRLIVYAINRCLLTAVIAIIEVVLFSVIPNPFYTFSIDFVIGKLYANSLLATLNSRANIRSGSTEYSSGALSTNFITTGMTTDPDPSVRQVRSRESTRDNRLRTVDLEMDGDSKQTKTTSTMRKGGRSWS